MLDLLIRNARVFDGSGTEPAIRDVAIQDGKIRTIGNRLPESAAQVVDADGLALMPGIIDSHTHFDAQVTWDPYVRPSPTLGVTTAVIGNCGFTIAPCLPEHRETAAALSQAAREYDDIAEDLENGAIEVPHSETR